MAKQKNKFVFVILTVTVFAMLLTFAACSNQESYKITIHPNNGEADIVWDRTKNFPTFEKEGFSVDGLFLDEQLTQPIALGDLQSMELTADIDVWVKWKETVVPTHSVIIHPNNGESDMVWELGDEIPTLKKVGYLFKGFFLDEQFSKEIVLQNLQTLDDDCEVWVKWINCPHDIFDENDVCTGCGYFDSGLDFSLNEDGESYSVSGIGTFTGTELVIPKVNFDTKPVTSIGYNALASCTGLTSVTIPDSVTSIGFGAFQGCSNLTSITISDGVTSIGSYAFNNTAWCNNQPDGLVYAGKVAYKYKGTMPSNTSIVIKDGTLGIAGSAFYDCTGLTSIIIPDSVTSIGDGVFYGCTSLTSITIPDSVTSIGSSAFSGCTGLTSITIPDSAVSYTHLTLPTILLV